MRYKEIERRYGKKLAKKIIKKMNGQTIGVNKDRSLDYYEGDIKKAVQEIKIGKDIGWD